MTSEICEDYISRKALKEKIQKDPAPLNETWEELYDYIIDAIDNANCVAPKHHWIPCSQELPERDQSVLGYCRDKLFDYQRVVWIDEYTGRWTNLLGHNNEVIAWMPLPEPYEEGKYKNEGRII